MRLSRRARTTATVAVAVVCFAACQARALSAQTDLRPLLDFADPEGTEARLRTHLEVARESGDQGYVAEVLTQLARTFSRRGRFEEAHRQLDEVEALLSSEYPRAMIRYRLERGRTLNLQGDGGLAWNEAHKGPESVSSLAARWNVGRALRALERFEEALELQEALLAEYERLELRVYGYVYEELAELYLGEGDPRAPEYFGLAFEALSRDVWMVNSQADRLARLARLAALDNQ